MTGFISFLFRKWILRTILLLAVGIPIGQQAFGTDFGSSQIFSGMQQSIGHVLSKFAGDGGGGSGFLSSASAAAIQPPADAQIEVAFSPNAGAEDLIVKVIRSGRSNIDVMAYAFTSAPITKALIDAQKRGVQVRLVADEKQNLKSGGPGEARGRAALSALSNAGAKVYVSSEFASHHDKVVMVDGKHLQTGSFNFSTSAQTRNSENVIVLWNNPGVVQKYTRHFERNLSGAKVFNPY